MAHSTSTSDDFALIHDTGKTGSSDITKEHKEDKKHKTETDRCSNAKVPTVRKSGSGKVCFYTRDEIIYIDPALIAYVKADGNYVEVFYVNSIRFHVNYSISKVFDMLYDKKKSQMQFIKLSRSMIINANYIQKILPLKSQLILSDDDSNTIILSLPKKTLRKLYTMMLSSTRS